MDARLAALPALLSHPTLVNEVIEQAHGPRLLFFTLPRVLFCSRGECSFFYLGCAVVKFALPPLPPLPLPPLPLPSLFPLLMSTVLKTYVGDGTDAFGYVGVDTVGEMIVVAFKGTSDLQDWVRGEERQREGTARDIAVRETRETGDSREVGQTWSKKEGGFIVPTREHANTAAAEVQLPAKSQVTVALHAHACPPPPRPPRATAHYNR